MKSILDWHAIHSWIVYLRIYSPPEFFVHFKNFKLQRLNFGD